MINKIDEADLGPSKSELKRQMIQRQKLAEVLSELSSDALNSIPIEDKNTCPSKWRK